MANVAAIIETMEALGHKPEDILAVVKAAALSAPLSKGAERTRKWRERKAESVTSDVTVTRNGDADADKKEIPPTPPKEKTTSLTIVREKTNTRDADFARVREAYPKRVGGDPRKTAMKAFDAAIKRGADLEAIVSGARAFATIRSSDDPKFTPMLATWLNQDRWLEDYTAPPSRAGPKPQRSVLSRIATGEFFDEPDSNYHDQPSANAANSSRGGFAAEVPERARADGGGAVVDLRPTSSGWR
jgi:hypothetical protein